MKLPPVACSLRVAASPLKGASPAAWQSQFRGDPRMAPHFTQASRVTPRILENCHDC